MTRIRHSIMLAGTTLAGLAIFQSTAHAQETWTSELVGDDPWWASEGVTSEPPDHLSCGDGHAVGLAIASALFIDTVNLRCATIGGGGEHGIVRLASADPAGGGVGFGIGSTERVEKDYDCRPGEVVAGFRGKSGDYIDRLEVGCRSVDSGEMRWLTAAGGTGGTDFGSVSCPSGMGVDRMEVWSMEAYEAAGLVYRWIPYSVTKFTFRCKALPGSLPVQQVAGRLDYAVALPPQVLGGQLDVDIKEAPEAPASPEASSPAEEGAPATPAPPEPDPEPAPAESGEMSAPAPEPAPVVTPRTPMPAPGVVSPRVEMPVRQPITAMEPPPPTEAAPVEEPEPENGAPAPPTEAPLEILLSVKPGSVRGGETAQLTIRLSRAAVTEEQVLLSSGTPERVQLPERVTIAAGRQEVRVDVTTIGTVERPTRVSIQASFGNGERPVETILLVRPKSPGENRDRDRDGR